MMQNVIYKDKCASLSLMFLQSFYNAHSPTYSVEQSKQCTGSQTAAWRPHVSQF